MRCGAGRVSGVHGDRGGTQAELGAAPARRGHEPPERRELAFAAPACGPRHLWCPAGGKRDKAEENEVTSLLSPW